MEEYSFVHVKQNEYQMQMNRIFMALIAGVVSGILRVEGVASGLMMYILSNLVGSAIICVNLGGVTSSKSYFPNGVRDIMTGQIFSGFLTFILVWTLVYDIVHIF